MEPLPTLLRVQNRTLKQIKRQGQAALYALSGMHGALYGYELVIIRIRKAEEVFGKFYPERETYPPSEAWGVLAWSYGRDQKQDACAAFETLCAKLSDSLPIEDLAA